VDFVANYDIKIRMGRDTENDEQGALVEIHEEVSGE
jgi:hypothetical protein